MEQQSRHHGTLLPWAHLHSSRHRNQWASECAGMQWVGFVMGPLFARDATVHERVNTRPGASSFFHLLFPLRRLWRRWWGGDGQRLRRGGCERSRWTSPRLGDYPYWHNAKVDISLPVFPKLCHSIDSDVLKAQILLLGFAEAIFYLAMSSIQSLCRIRSIDFDPNILSDEPGRLMLRVGVFCKCIERCFRKHSARSHLPS